MTEWTSPDESIRLFNADCMDILPTLPAGGIDCVITSPPYNLGATPWPALGHWRPGHKCSGGNGKWKRGSASAARGVDYGTHSDSMPWGEYVAWQRECLSSLWRVTADRGAIFYNHKPRVVGDTLWLPLELLPDEVVMRQIITWDRGGGINYTATAFVPMCEWLIVLAKRAFRLRSTGVSGLGDVWRFPPDIGNPHPAPFPLDLPSRALQSLDADLVCDPFMGSGSTGVAAVRGGKRFLGIEKHRPFFDLAVARIRAELNRAPLFTETQASLFDSAQEQPT